MERLPTQTDLIRLCDAADRITKYHQQSVLQNRGLVVNVLYDMDNFTSIVRLLPYPRHYWTPFHIDFWEARDRWNGWTDEVYRSFGGVIFHARNILQHWVSGGIHKADPYAKIQLRISTHGFLQEEVCYLREQTNLLRERLKSPWPFNLHPDAKLLSFFRDEPQYRNKVARLGDWFPIVAAICNAGGFLSHEEIESAYKAADFKGRYDNAFRKAVNTKINHELYPLGVELTASRGEGWKIELFSQTLP